MRATGVVMEERARRTELEMTSAPGSAVLDAVDPGLRLKGVLSGLGRDAGGLAGMPWSLCCPDYLATGGRFGRLDDLLALERSCDTAPLF